MSLSNQNGLMSVGGMVSGGPVQAPTGPLLSTRWSGNLNAQSRGYGAADVAAMTSGAPFNQPQPNAYKQGLAYYNIDDLIATTVTETTNFIMNRLQGSELCYFVAMPTEYIAGDKVVVNNVIFNNDAPAQRSPEAPNPVMTSRTTQKVITLKKHGVSIKQEDMALATPSGKHMLALQIQQAQENFTQYFTTLIATELMRPHQAEDLSGSLVRRGRVFNSEDEFIAHASRLANEFNVWNKNTSGLTHVNRSAAEAINNQGGMYNLLIVPQNALDLDAMAKYGNLQSPNAPPMPGIPRVMPSPFVPMVGADPLEGMYSTGQRAIFEYAALPPSQMDIDIHDERADSMQPVSFANAVALCGAFQLNPQGYVTALTEYGTEFFNDYRDWSHYCETHGVLGDLTNAFAKLTADAQTKFLDNALRSTTNPGTAARRRGNRVNPAYKSKRNNNSEIVVNDPDHMKKEYAEFIDILKLLNPHETMRSVITALLRLVYTECNDKKKWADAVNENVISEFVVELKNPNYSVSELNTVASHLPATWSDFASEIATAPGAKRYAEELIKAAKNAESGLELKVHPAGIVTTFKEILKLPPRKYPAFFSHLLDADLPIPGTILLVRPCVTFTASATIACASGGGTGRSFYGQSTSTWGGNAAISNKVASINLRFGAAVTNANNLHVFPHSQVKRYVGGGSSDLVDWSSEDVRSAYQRRDPLNMGMIAILCPPHFRINLPVIDFTGHFPEELVPSGMKKEPHYPTAAVVSNILRVEHGDVDSARTMQVLGENTLLWQMQQRPRTKAAADVGINNYEGVGPLGAFAPGSAAQRRGETGPPVAIRNAEQQIYTPFQR